MTTLCTHYFKSKHLWIHFPTSELFFLFITERIPLCAVFPLDVLMFFCQDSNRQRGPKEHFPITSISFMRKEKPYLRLTVKPFPITFQFSFEVCPNIFFYIHLMVDILCQGVLLTCSSAVFKKSIKRLRNIQRPAARLKRESVWFQLKWSNKLF